MLSAGEAADTSELWPAAFALPNAVAALPPPEPAGARPVDAYIVSRGSSLFGPLGKAAPSLAEAVALAAGLAACAQHKGPAPDPATARAALLALGTPAEGARYNHARSRLPLRRPAALTASPVTRAAGSDRSSPLQRQGLPWTAQIASSGWPRAARASSTPLRSSRIADKFIDLANRENARVKATDLHMALLYAAARYNAHVANVVLAVPDHETFVTQMVEQYRTCCASTSPTRRWQAARELSLRLSRESRRSCAASAPRSPRRRGNRPPCGCADGPERHRVLRARPW